MRVALRLCLAAAALAACSAERADEDDHALDLLVRMPDQVFDQPGLLVPRPGVDWGEAKATGWARLESDDAWRLPDGAHFLETNQPTARLGLRAGEPADRTLELTVWRRRGPAGSKRTATLRFNDVELADLALTDAPETHRLPVPRALWHRGLNTLELAVEELDAPVAGARRWDTLAVAGVRYGPELLVTYDLARREHRIPSGAGLRYLVETASAATLRLSGRASEEGTLTVRFGSVNASTGEGGASVAVPLVLRDEFERELPLGSGDALQFVELLWSSDAAGALSLARADVVEETPVDRPIVLLISVDTLSARHLSLHGYGRRTTPRLEELAEDAVVFERCVANAPWTLPSYLSTLTGLYPSAHQAKKLVPDEGLDNYDFWHVADDRWTLAEMLRARGYQTAAALDTAWLSRRFAIDQGFDVYDLEASLYPFHLPEYGIRYIHHQFEAYLDDVRDPRAPFFAFLHTGDAHGPYWPEEEFLGEYDADLPEDRRPTPAGSALQTYRALPDWMAFTQCPPELRADVMQWDVPPALPLEEVIARYDETILKTDRYIGAILDELKARGLYEDAVVVVTGDHGESFGHEAFGHGVLWEDVLEVPLIVKLPRSERGGTRVRPSVQLVDLYPTLMELAGVRGPREYLHGRSLLPLMRGATESSPTYSEGGLIDQRTVELDGWKLIETRPGHQAAVASLVSYPRVPAEWLRDNLPELATTGILTDDLVRRLESDAAFAPRFEELKRLMDGPFYALYHLTADPNEEHDLAASEPEKVRELLALLRAEQARGEAARRDPRADVVPVRLSSEELEQLRKLGYSGEEGGR